MLRTKTDWCVIELRHKHINMVVTRTAALPTTTTARGVEDAPTRRLITDVRIDCAQRTVPRIVRTCVGPTRREGRRRVVASSCRRRGVRCNDWRRTYHLCAIHILRIYTHTHIHTYIPCVFDGFDGVRHVYGERRRQKHGETRRDTERHGETRRDTKRHEETCVGFSVR